MGSMTPATAVDDAALANEADTTNWAGYGRTCSEQRCSLLTRINTTNVRRLGIDGYLDLPKDRALNMPARPACRRPDA